MQVEESLEETIKLTSEVLSDFLIAKFIPRIAYSEVLGAATNYSVINKVSNFARIKYKKRYLKNNL